MLKFCAVLAGVFVGLLVIVWIAMACSKPIPRHENKGDENAAPTNPPTAENSGSTTAAEQQNRTTTAVAAWWWLNHQSSPKDKPPEDGKPS